MTKQVLILGASGKIAQFVANELADAPDISLTLFARTPAKITNPAAPIIQGDALNEDELVAAMTGKDLIYANLGPRQMVALAESVTHAAQKAGVKRLIWVATAGIYNEFNPAHSAELEKMFGSVDDPTSYFGDERRAADIVDASPLATTILRPNTLTNDQIIQDILVTDRNESLKGQAISRKTVGHFISELIKDDHQYINDSIAISAI